MNNIKTSRMFGWTARIIGITIATVWFIILLLSAIAEWSEPILLEGIVLIVLVIINIASVIISWWLSKIGGILLMTFGVAFCIFGYISAGHNHYFAVLISGFPFLVAGIFSILGWYKSRPR